MNLKAANGQFVQRVGDMTLVANLADGTVPAAQVTVESQGASVVALKQEGVYWSAQPDGSLQCNRAVVGGWEAFERVTGQRQGSVAYRSTAFDRYVSAPPSGPLNCGATAVNDWESFDLPANAVGTLDPLAVTGLTFANGWQYRGATDFRLLKRILDGEDVTPILQQRQQAGANILRVLTMAGNLFPLDPDTYSDADFARAVALVNGFGLRLELVALADCAQPLTKPLSWQQAHLARIGAAAGALNLCELGNEINNWYQNVNPLQFSKPVGCLSSRGSTTGYQNYCPLPPWDYSTIHGDRDEKWLQNIAKAGMDLVDGFPGYGGTHGPLVHNEPTKAPYPRTRPEDWFIAGVQCAVWRDYGVGGGLFHCEAGLQSQPWNDTELASAINFYKGMTQGTR